MDSVVLDDRDQLSQSVNNYKTHSITVKNLDPNTSYYFSIKSANKTYLNSTNPYKVETGGRIDKNPSSQIPISGKVVMPNGEAASEGIVIVAVDGAQEISTYLKTDGTYALPLNNLRNKTLDDYFTIEPSMIISIEVYSQNLFSSVSVSAVEIDPVPLITLSNTYDFSNPSPDLSTQSPKSSDSGSFPTFGKVPKSNGDPKILSPDTNEDSVDAQPTFEGTAQPNETVEIIIRSEEKIQTQVKADANGKWTYTPPKNLSPGEHTITIVTKNKNGILKTITQKFSVFAAENNLSPTSNPTPANSAISIPFANNSFVIIAAVGFAAAALGIILFFLTRGKTSL